MSDKVRCEGECSRLVPPDYLFDGLCLTCSAPSRNGGEA